MIPCAEPGADPFFDLISIPADRSARSHKLCRLVGKILHRGIGYEERGPEISKASKQKRTRKMIQQLRRLGYRIEPSPSPSAITA
jgi:hypothetical protein